MAKDNGAQFQDKSDIEKLISILERIEINSSPKKEGNIPSTPKYEDFVKNLGNLDLIVPMGFIMLHNDLEKLYNVSKNANGVKANEDGFSMSTSAIVGTITAISGSAIVSGLVRDMNLAEVLECLRDTGDWVINKLPQIGEFATNFISTALPALTKTVEEAANIVGKGLATTFMDIADILADSDIYNQRKELLSTYMNLYYSQTFENMGFAVTLDEKTGQILSITQAQEKDYFKGIDEDAGLDTILSTGTQAIISEGINLAKNGKLGSTIGKNVAGMITGKVQTWTDLVEEEAPQLALMDSQIFDMFADEDVKAEIKRMNKLYVQAYFGGMINNMGYEVDLSTGEVTKSLEKDYFADVDTSSITTTITGSLTTVLDTALNQFSDGTLGTNIGKAIGGFFSGQVEAIASSIGNSVTSIASGITSLQMLGEGPSDKVKEAYGYYMQAYYANMIAGLGYDIDFSTGTLTRAVSFESVRTLVLDTVGDVIKAPIKWLVSGFTDIVSDVSDSIADSDMKDELRESVIDYVTAVYAEASNATEVVSSAKNFAQTYFSKLNEEIENDADYYQLDSKQKKALKANIIEGFKSTSATLNSELKSQVEILSTYDDTELRKEISQLREVVSLINGTLTTQKYYLETDIIPAVKEISSKEMPIIVNSSSGGNIDNSDLASIV